MIKILLILVLISSISYGQTQTQIDSISSEICKSIITNSQSSDSLKVTLAYRNVLDPFMLMYPEELRDQIWSNIYFRLQRNCTEYLEILVRGQSSIGDWEILDKLPDASKDKRLCKEFFKQKHFYYLETNGDTVRLTIENGYWTDTFKDETYSKLKVYPLDDCRFEIEFVESDNHMRKNFSNPGDRYRYQILDRGKNYYYMSLELSEVKQYTAFKLYY